MRGMNAVSLLRRNIPIATCLVALVASGIFSAHAKAMNTNERIALESQGGQEPLAERRLCRYEQNECQLISEIFLTRP
jgi:hypothetical protein